MFTMLKFVALTALCSLVASSPAERQKRKLHSTTILLNCYFVMLMYFR